MEINPYLDKKNNLSIITPEGHNRLSQLVTDTVGPVYAFYDQVSPKIIAAAMARLSRRGSDLREIILDEFTLSSDESADSLIQRVVTAYGDDSVQQLVGQHLVVENASNLLTKKLEWGRFGAYLEQSTRYIFFDELDQEGKYKYFVPEDLSEDSKMKYTETLDQIFETYSKMVRDLTDFVRIKHKEPDTPEERIAWRAATRAQACDSIRAVLPVATKSTVGIFASSQAIENLVIRLLSDNLLEAQKVGHCVLQEVRKVIPAFYERTDKIDRGTATSAYLSNKRARIQELASDLVDTKDVSSSSVELLDFWPENELEIVPDLLFSESQISTKGLKAVIAQYSQEKQIEILKTYMGERLNRRHRPGRAMEFPHYKFEITADYGTFRDLQRHRVVDGFEWQQLTINNGYDIPELVKEAGMSDSFNKCFELSEGLVEYLQTKGLNETSQYATLLGHKMRYRFMINAREAFHLLELRTSPQGHPGYRKIAKTMFDLISEKHPNIAGSMIFVNKGEDPELTRLAAERATQYKLNKLKNI